MQLPLALLNRNGGLSNKLLSRKMGVSVLSDIRNRTSTCFAPRTSRTTPFVIFPSPGMITVARSPIPIGNYSKNTALPPQLFPHGTLGARTRIQVRRWSSAHMLLKRPKHSLGHRQGSFHLAQAAASLLASRHDSERLPCVESTTACRPPLCRPVNIRLAMPARHHRPAIS